MNRFKSKKFPVPRPAKPCKCGSGFYCAKHMRYGVEAEPQPLRVIKKSRTSKIPGVE